MPRKRLGAAPQRKVNVRTPCTASLNTILVSLQTFWGYGISPPSPVAPQQILITNQNVCAINHEF